MQVISPSLFFFLLVVAYFSEFGRITSPPRLWAEVAAFFDSEMTPV